MANAKYAPPYQPQKSLAKFPPVKNVEKKYFGMARRGSVPQEC
jgi:hypothetical protein